MDNEYETLVQLMAVQVGLLMRRVDALEAQSEGLLAAVAHLEAALRAQPKLRTPTKHELGDF